MAKKTHTRGRPAPTLPTPYEECRDELFQHIMRCGVIGAAPEHQEEWFAATMKYLEERYPELGAEQLGELRTLGLRFAQPAKKSEAKGEAVTAA
jgi:hypothetical protein